MTDRYGINKGPLYSTSDPTLCVSDVTEAPGRCGKLYNVMPEDVALSILSEHVKNIWTPWWRDVIYLMPVGSVLQVCHIPSSQNCFRRLTFQIKVNVKSELSLVHVWSTVIKTLFVKSWLDFKIKESNYFNLGPVIVAPSHLMGADHLTTNSKHISWALHAYGDIFSLTTRHYILVLLTILGYFSCRNL